MDPAEAETATFWELAADPEIERVPAEAETALAWVEDPTPVTGAVMTPAEAEAAIFWLEATGPEKVWRPEDAETARAWAVATAARTPIDPVESDTALG